MTSTRAIVIAAIAALLAGAAARAQTSPPEIRFDAVDPLRPPADMYLGEVAGVAVDKAGDIYVFHPPTSETCADPAEGENNAGQDGQAACDAPQKRESTQTYVKRVVGLPGDRLSIRNGNVVRNGVQEKDPYTIPCDGGGECTFPQTITVPKGDYYMMGDNRPDSLDSRFWGPVPKAWLIGKVFFTYWPPDRIGTL